MDRQQAVDVIKEIFQRCDAVEGKSLKLLPPKEDNSLSNTFQIHVEMRDDICIKRCVQDISKKHKLATKLIDDWLIIYKPYPRKH